jgi:aspartate aminotransferase
VPGVRSGQPQGAFYVFPRVADLFGDKVTSADDLAAYLIDKAHVVTVPGTAFGRDGYLRLSFAVELERLREAMDRLSEACVELGS